MNVPLHSLVSCQCRPHPYRLSQVEIRYIKSQGISAHIVRKMAIWTIHSAQVVEITSLAKDHGLVRVIEENRRFADEIDQAV